ncbi:MAG: T9SS type A sorting domain-containing protein, partial [Bacteroidota bacterium]
LVAITGNTAICNTLQGVLTATGSYFYLWNNGATASTNTISPTGPTTVSVVGTTLDGCKDSASVVISVINNLSITIGGPDSICAGQTILLSANVTGATTYSWNTGAQTQNITVSPASTYTYIVTASNPGCTGSKQHEVFVKSLPVIDFNVTTPLCSDAGTYTLSAVPLGGVYVGSGISGNTFDPGVGIGVYPISYQVTGSNGCTTASTKTIEVVSCVGINEHEAENFMTLYPNPVQGKVTIHSSTPVKSVSVLDYTGKLIKQVEYTAVQDTQLDLSGLASGMYTFVVSTVNGHSKTIKIVKE